MTGSNVLRNAFRVVQVLRAFGDGYGEVLEKGLDGLFAPPPEDWRSKP